MWFVSGKKQISNSYIDVITNWYDNAIIRVKIGHRRDKGNYMSP